MHRYLPIFILVLLTLPVLALAQEKFVPLVGIPGLDPNKSSFQGYINALFTLAISVAAVLAVIKLIMAGVQYMFSEIPSVKSDAKGDIWGAILGLLIIIGSVTLLNTINTNLTSFDVFRNGNTVSGGSSHNSLRENEREENQNVISKFSGGLGSAEHQAFIKQCLSRNGRAVASAADVRIVECRTK